MIRAAWRDVIFRRRRFAIAILATALVFALSLLLSGVSASFAREADRTVRAVGGDYWIVRDGSPGPFTSFRPLRVAWAEQLVGGGVVAAGPMLVIHQVIQRTNHGGRLVADSPFLDVTLFGIDPVGLGAPRIVDGRGIEGGSDAVVDRRLGYVIGDQFAIGPRVVTVVGRTRGATLFGGLANVYVSLDTAQAVFSGLGNTEPVANAIIVKGEISPPVIGLEKEGSVPLKLLTLRDVRNDVLRPLAGAQRTIDLVRVLLWIVAGCIVASIIYVTALERSRDFAVFKATGTATSRIFVGLVTQALLLAIGAGLVSVVVAWGLGYVFPIPVAVPAFSYAFLAVLAVVVGVLASLAGVRRVVSVDRGHRVRGGMTMSTMASGLTVDRLTVEFARGGQMVRALNDISFSVDAGSMLLILGPSGCGKTTLLSCLAGLRRPTSGMIRHGDVAVETLDRGSLDAYRRRVGIIFQSFNLVESLTSAENVAVPMRSAGTSERQARQRAVTLLESVGLGDCADRRPGQLSGGQQQRVAVARALALDPPLVIADEPTAHLDQHNVEATLRLLRRLTDEGRIVIVSTHDTRLVPLAEQTIDLAPSTLPTGASPGLIELEDGQDLFHEGDGPDWIYFVVSGSIDLIQGDISVASAGVGEWFGEMGPLFSLPRSATARACGFTVVEPVSVGEFRSRLGLATLRDLLGRRSETY